MKVNGSEILLKDSVNLQEFLEKHQYDTTKIAVEKNSEIIPKANYKEVMLSDTDVLEIVSFVGGG
ncbi:sulfur carrier protein ThiS [Anaerosacchariphilus polymeriproducens]|uniref:Sulfur carrier protein ThiS n=1 Tax=Anaerosacchariphilus polymeriproducens TaxID=1812858 RepID=A0A371ASV5_9FIRM|nr:sulfur carrier protein ThiS [Anaerosacchariphilus polymeriproducens]RDU22629.1 sulfur carrier protein ThiS [Anaerosacchariphilus polymeriproducens]